MNKPLTRLQHGIIDYAYSGIVTFLPELVKFKDTKNAITLCRALAGGALVYSLLTKAEWGVVKIIPFKTHLLIDFTTSLFAIGAPWILGFSKSTRARNTLIGVGVAGLTASLLTQANEREL